MPKQIGDLKVYNVAEVSELLGISDRTLRIYLRDGKLKGTKLANKWFVTEESLKTLLSGEEEVKELDLNDKKVW